MAHIHINLFSTCLMRTVSVNAFIPMDKIITPGMAAREKKPFKTLYLLHGIFGNHNDWLNNTRVCTWAEERNLAIIMPSGENRFYVDNICSGEKFGEFIGRELVAMTRELLPLSERREDTYIAGLSMGGYGAVRNGLKYHDTFACVAGLSSAFILDKIMGAGEDAPWFTHRRSYYQSILGDLETIQGSDNDHKALVDMILAAKAKMPALYLGCGSEDDFIGCNRDFHEFLSERGVEHTWDEDPGGHTWDYWDEHILKVLNWLPLEK